MEIAEDILHRYVRLGQIEGIPRNEREEMTQKFLDALNARRVAEGFKPYTYPRLSKMLQGIPTGDLWAFYQQCDQARSFGAYFHWALKPKPDGNQMATNRQP